jgi:probable HAF family extracellular repeat protein
MIRCTRLLFCFVAFTASAFCATATYTITDLGALPGMDSSVGRAINASAQTTGASGKNGSDSAQVFVNTDGSWDDLGTLGGPSGIGNGINSSGVVAGYSENSHNAYRAFISSDGTLVDIGDLGGGSAVAYAINDAGDVVGSAVTADGSNHPFLYSNGQMIDLGTLGSPAGNDWWNVASGINNSGLAVGTSYDTQGNFLGFTWSGGKIAAMETLGGLWSQAYAVNNSGQITGIAYNKAGDAHAFITKPNGKLKDLGTLAGKLGTSWGFAINDAGVVVGQSTTATGDYHAFVYDGEMRKDLNKLIPKKSGWVLYEARGINNAGQIICSGMKSDGTEHAILLTPR